MLHELALGLRLLLLLLGLTAPFGASLTLSRVALAILRLVLALWLVLALLVTALVTTALFSLITMAIVYLFHAVLISGILLLGRTSLTLLANFVLLLLLLWLLAALVAVGFMASTAAATTTSATSLAATALLELLLLAIDDVSEIAGGLVDNFSLNLSFRGLDLSLFLLLIIFEPGRPVFAEVESHFLGILLRIKLFRWIIFAHFSLHGLHLFIKGGLLVAVSLEDALLFLEVDLHLLTKGQNLINGALITIFVVVHKEFVTFQCLVLFMEGEHVPDLIILVVFIAILHHHGVLDRSGSERIELLHHLSCDIASAHGAVAVQEQVDLEFVWGLLLFNYHFVE
jgi:hypothetical protein